MYLIRKYAFLLLLIQFFQHSKLKFMYYKPEYDALIKGFNETDATYISIMFLLLLVFLWIERNIF